MVMCKKYWHVGGGFCNTQAEDYRGGDEDQNIILVENPQDHTEHAQGIQARELLHRETCDDDDDFAYQSATCTYGITRVDEFHFTYARRTNFIAVSLTPQTSPPYSLPAVGPLPRVSLQHAPFSPVDSAPLRTVGGGHHPKGEDTCGFGQDRLLLCVLLTTIVVGEAEVSEVALGDVLDLYRGVARVFRIDFLGVIDKQHFWHALMTFQS